MEQVRAALLGPHGGATAVTLSLAGVAIAIAIVEALRRGPQHARWSRPTAVAFPAAVAVTMLVGSVTPELTGRTLEVGMFLRMLGFWATVLLAPLAVGQVVELRPPRWLQRTHLALAGGFLLLQATSDLVLTRGGVFHPPTLFGPLAVAFLVPVAAFAGWWLLACLARVSTRSGLALFALGGSITTLALIVAALVVDPVLADRFLVLGFLPVVAAATLLSLQRAWRDRRLRGTAARRRARGAR